MKKYKISPTGLQKIKEFFNPNPKQSIMGISAEEKDAIQLLNDLGYTPNNFDEENAVFYYFWIPEKFQTN